MRPVVRPKMGYWLFLPPLAVELLGQMQEILGVDVKVIFKTKVHSSLSLCVKSRLFINTFDEEIGFFCAPFLQRLNGRLVVQGSLRDRLVDRVVLYENLRRHLRSIVRALFFQRRTCK